MGHTHPTQSPFILTQHPQSIWMCMFWVILEWKKAYAFESEVGMSNHSQQAGRDGSKSLQVAGVSPGRSSMSIHLNLWTFFHGIQILCGRYTDSCLQEQWDSGGAISQRTTHGYICQPLGWELMGHTRGEIPCELGCCTFCCIIQGIWGRWMRGSRWQHCNLCSRSCVCLVECTTIPIPNSTTDRCFEICAKHLSSLRLLCR